jgi:hypothetical protein
MEISLPILSIFALWIYINNKNNTKNQQPTILICSFNKLTNYAMVAASKKEIGKLVSVVNKRDKYELAYR